MTWRNRPMMGLDFETTSIDCETTTIVTACLGVASAKGWTARNWLSIQTEPIPAEATAIHGISTQFANDHGTDPAANLAEIVEQLYMGWERGYPVVGHNLGGYDLTTLDRNLRRHGLDPLEVRGPALDTLVLDRGVDRYRKGRRNLQTVAAHYGFVLSDDDAHGAEADALTSCRLAWRMSPMCPCPADVLDPLSYLHAWQQELYAEQQLYFIRRNGETPNGYNTAWPLRPLPVAAEAVA